MSPEPTIAASIEGAPELSDRQQLLDLLRALGVDPEDHDLLEEPLLRTSQVATLLRTSDRTIRSWSDAGKLRFFKTLGGRRLFPASAVVGAMRAMQVSARDADA